MAKKRLTISRRIAALTAEGFAVLNDDKGDKEARLAALRIELAELQTRLEAERQRKAAHMRARRRARPKPDRTMTDEVSSRARAVETRRAALLAMPEGSSERTKAVRSLQIAERTLTKFERIQCLLS